MLKNFKAYIAFIFASFVVAEDHMGKAADTQGAVISQITKTGSFLRWLSGVVETIAVAGSTVTVPVLSNMKARLSNKADATTGQKAPILTAQVVLDKDIDVTHKVHLSETNAMLNVIGQATKYEDMTLNAILQGLQNYIIEKMIAFKAAVDAELPAGTYTLPHTHEVAGAMGLTDFQKGNIFVTKVGGSRLMRAAILSSYQYARMVAANTATFANTSSTIVGVTDVEGMQTWLGTYLIEFDALDADDVMMNENLTFFVSPGSVAYAMNDIIQDVQTVNKNNEILSLTSVGCTPLTTTAVVSIDDEATEIVVPAFYTVAHTA